MIASAAACGSYLPSLRWGERIETVAFSGSGPTIRDLPSLRWGERIETRMIRTDQGDAYGISPHFGGGSGLKLHRWDQFVESPAGSPLTSVGGAD